jgi:hypothetical protein
MLIFRKPINGHSQTNDSKEKQDKNDHCAVTFLFDEFKAVKFDALERILGLEADGGFADFTHGKVLGVDLFLRGLLHPLNQAFFVGNCSIALASTNSGNLIMLNRLKTNAALFYVVSENFAIRNKD